MENTEYEQAWNDDKAPGETPAHPATSAVQAAAVATRDGEAKEFSEAFHAETPAEPAPEAKPEPKNFREAFKAARAEGLKVFEWQGKKYTTEVKAKAAPVAPAATNAAPAAPVASAPATAPTKSRLDILNAMRAKDAAIKGVKTADASPPRQALAMDPKMLGKNNTGMGV